MARTLAKKNHALTSIRDSLSYFEAKLDPLCFENYYLS